MADRCSPTDVQLTSRSARDRPRDRSAPRSRCQFQRSLRAAIPYRHAGRARVLQGPDGGARAAPGAQHERARMGGHPSQAPERGDQAGRVGVVRLDRAVVAESERVGRPDRARRRARLVGQLECGVLVRDRDVRSDESRLRPARALSARTAPQAAAER